MKEKKIELKELKDAELPKNALPKMKPLIHETPKLTTECINST